jgi:hypothetical protein
MAVKYKKITFVKKQMALPNIFNRTVADEVIQRINTLSTETQPTWGKMSVDQMIAHCNVTYEMTFENIHKKPNAFIRFILKNLVKSKVVSEKPYGKSGQTAPEFVIKGTKNFEEEKARLIEYINKSQGLGESHFNNKESQSFGILSSVEWNNMFYKHLDHHLSQFGA